MGRCAVFESVGQEAELLIGLFLAETQQAEHPLLQVGVRDTDGAAGQLNAVEHQVVSLCPHVALIAFQIGDALLQRSGEGMVHGHILAQILVKLEEGELHHPQEVVALALNAQLVGHFQTESA